MKFAVLCFAPLLPGQYVPHFLGRLLTAQIEVFVILLYHTEVLGQILKIVQNHFHIFGKSLVSYACKLVVLSKLLN
jgi:hypothetical protein